MAHNSLQKFIISLSVVVLIMFIYIGYKQMDTKFDLETKDIHSELDNVLRNIDETLDSSKTHLDLMGNLLEKDYYGIRSSEQLFMNPQYFEEVDRFVVNVEVDKVQSSLSGIGEWDQLEESMHSEIKQVAILNPLFQMTQNNLKNIQWVYYVSKKGFINLYPYVPPEDYVFTEETFEQGFYRMVTPENNKDKRIIATRVYEDEAGAGLMITLSRPVYVNEEFWGSLSLDFTLNQLNEILVLGAKDNRQYLLVNEYGELIASNVSPLESKHIRFFEEYLETVGIPLDELATQADSDFVRIGNKLVKQVDIQLFDWELYVFSDMSYIGVEIMNELALQFLVVMIVVSYIAFYIKKNTYTLQVYNSQLKFEQVIDQAVQLMAILDTKGKILYVNQTAVDMIGMESKDLVGEYFYDTPWWNWSQELMHFIKEAVFKTSNGDHVKRDVVHYDMEGQAQNVEFSMNPIYNNKNEIEYLVANGKNITDRIKLKESMDELLKSDPLTNLGNRRAVIDKIEDEIAMFDRHGIFFSILLLDVDHFKRVNDTYGHNVGDEVLIKLGKAIKVQVRPYDVVGRWGGEEFIIVLPNTDYDEAMQMAQRIRKSISELKVKSLTSPPVDHVTITVGVSVYNQPSDLKEIVRQADDALYFGKTNGRNQVVAYKDLKRR